MPFVCVKQAGWSLLVRCHGGMETPQHVHQQEEIGYPSWGSLIHMPAGCSLAGEAMFLGQACREQDQLAGHMNATSVLNVKIQGPVR